MEAQTKLKQNGHGGARAGAGRQAPLGRQVLLTIRILPGLRELILAKAGPQKGALTRYVEGVLKRDLDYVPKKARGEVLPKQGQLSAVVLPDPQPPAPPQKISVPAIAAE